MSQPDRLGANKQLIGLTASRAVLATPALLLDLDALEANIAKMAELIRPTGLQLRPHAKTHKSIAIARLQIDAGAIGICVATLREAEVMARAGIPGIHVTTPLANRTSLGAFLDCLEGPRDVSVVVDSIAGLELLNDALAGRNIKLKALVDVDLGTMYRTGVATGQELVHLACGIARSERLEFGGVQFYSGIIQHVSDASERATLYTRELEKLTDALGLLKAEGLEPPIVTGGGTGTFLLDGASGVLTENQAGSYVLMDVEYDAVKISTETPKPFRPAAFIQCSVISNNANGMVTVDGGTKCFPADGPLPRILTGVPDECIYQFFGDEFGAVLFGELAARMAAAGPAPERTPRSSPYEQFHAFFGGSTQPIRRLEIGSKVEFMLPHCDPAINLHNFYHCMRGDVLVDIWPIDARGPL